MEITEQDKFTVDRKSGFIVAFIAAAFTLKDFGQSSHVISFGLFDIQIINILYIFIGFLLISAYLYGLNYFLYDYPKLEIVTKGSEKLATILYGFTFISPIILFILWILGYVYSYLHLGFQTVELLGTLTSTILGSLTLIFSFYRSAKKEEDLIEELELRQRALIEEAEKVGNTNHPYSTVIIIYNAVLDGISANLVRKLGKEISKMPPTRLIMLARNYKLLDEPEIKTIDKLRQLRNELVHSSNPVSIVNSDLTLLLNQTSDIINKLGKANKSSKWTPFSYHK